MYREDEVIEELRAAASAGGANPARIKKRHAVMNEITGKYCLGGFYPTLDTSEFGDVEVVDDTPDRDSLDALLENQAPLVDPRTASFFIIPFPRGLLSVGCACWDVSRNHHIVWK